MKYFGVPVIALLLGLLTACSAPSSVLPGEGKWRLVNYWALWCTPCREEIPVLNAFDQRADVKVLGVNFDRVQGEALIAQAAQLGITFDNLADDPAALFGQARPQVLPTTWLVDPSGRLVTTLIGPQTEASLARALQSAQR